MSRKNNYYSYRLAVEKLKCRNRILIVLIRLLVFLAVLADRS
ncbi:MAG: hypothetical protein ACXWOH_09800 [Bdellovibrionota bacterium]